LALVVASCGGGELTLTEYAQQVEGLTTTMYQKLDDLTIEAPSEPPTLEDLQAVYRGAATAYRGLLDGLQALEPPREAAELHTAALDLATRLTTAGEAFARRVEDVETEDELTLLFASPEALAAEAAAEEIVGFCQARQAELDATADREVLADVPWIPPEMQEVVLVAFGCETEERGAS
jgi:hypothetical protein